MELWHEGLDREEGREDREKGIGKRAENKEGAIRGEDQIGARVRRKSEKLVQ
jgi:hypothetical protein